MSSLLVLNRVYRLGDTVSHVGIFDPQHIATWRVVNTSVTDSPWHEDGFVVSYLHGLINYKKTPNPKCRLYWCLIEFVDLEIQ